MAVLSFFKKFTHPKFSFEFFKGGTTRVVGIDIGTASTKVVQLRYTQERAVLETYGELTNAIYLKEKDLGNGWLMRIPEDTAAALIKDVLKESNVTTTTAVVGIPSISSFITSVSFPFVSRKEIENAIPFEARKYIPIPLSEVLLDWDIIETNDDTQEVLLMAIPREIVERYKKICALAGLTLQSLEVETFSMIRALGGPDPAPVAFINIGHHTTTIAITDKGKLRVSHDLGQGSSDITRSLERGLNVNRERAETIKRDIGLSERIEEREIVSIITPFIETLFAEMRRIISFYNRKSSRKVQKINLTGGGSNLKGLIDYASTSFGMEVTRGNPFGRIVVPSFMQPILREIGPNFSVAVGLALHELSVQ